MQNRVLYKNNNIGFMLFVLSFMCFTVFSSYNAFMTIDLPFPVLIVFMLFQFFAFVCLSMKYQYKVPSIIAFLLIGRMMYFLINATIKNIGFEYIISEIAITFLAIYLFSFMYSFADYQGKVIKILLGGLGCMTSLQLIVGILLHGSAKTDIVAGLGHSNYAAAFLVLSFGVFLFDRASWLNVIVAVINLIGLSVTQSFGAYFAVVILIIIKIVISYDWSKQKTWIALFLIFGILVLAITLLADSSFLKPIITKIKQKIDFLLAGNFEAFGSSRLSLYRFSWNNIKKDIWFGQIINFEPTILEGDPSFKFQYARTHNLFLESILLYGLVGSLFNVALAIYLIKRILRNRKNSNIKLAVSYALLAAFIHGLIEPNFFTMHFDFVCWSLFGYLLSPNQDEDKEGLLTKIKEENNAKTICA